MKLRLIVHLMVKIVAYFMIIHTQKKKGKIKSYTRAERITRS